MPAQQKKILYVSLAAGILMSVIRIPVILVNMEQASLDVSTYYLDGGFAVFSFGIAVALISVFIAFLSFKAGYKRPCQLNTQRSHASVVSIICGFALLSEAIMYAIFIISDSLPIHSLGIMIVVFSVFSSVYFIYFGIHGCSRGNEKLLSLLALLPIFLSVFRLLGDFVRQSAVPLASSGGYHIMSLVALLLYFLCEGKMLSGNGNAFLINFFGNVSIVLLLVFAVPNLFLHSYWLLDFDYVSGFSLVDICLVAYVFVRLSSLDVGKPAEKAKAAPDAQMPE